MGSVEPRLVLGCTVVRCLCCCSSAVFFSHFVCLLLWAFIYSSTCFKEKEKRKRRGRWAASWELEPPLSSYWTFPNEVATLSLQCPQMHNIVWVQGSLDEFVLQDARGLHNYLRHRILRQIWILAAFGSLGFLYTHFGDPRKVSLTTLIVFWHFSVASAIHLSSSEASNSQRMAISKSRHLGCHK